ncbi:MAG: PDZ domain-containing protein [Pyrinomonadaceae bacterium]
MFQKSFAFVLFVLIGVGAVYSQTPEPKSEKQDAVRTMTWSFDSDGGYLGIQTEEVNRENFTKYGLREVRGVGIENVIDGSPAQAAGLQKGDVIVRVNGDEITSGMKLSRLINEISPDHQARLTVVRSGAEREITVTVGKRPGFKFDNGSFELLGPTGRIDIPRIDMPSLENLPRIAMPPMPPMSGEPDEPLMQFFGSRRQIGVGLTPLTKQLADHFGVESGALVNNVRENSAAAKAGIRAGDVITEVDGKPVKGEFDLMRAISEKRDGSLNLTIVRDRNRQTISVTPEEVKGVFDNYFEFTTPAAPGAPQAPGVLRMTQPVVPGPPPAPVPLFQRMLRGRVI